MTKQKYRDLGGVLAHRRYDTKSMHHASLYSSGAKARQHRPRPRFAEATGREVSLQYRQKRIHARICKVNSIPTKMGQTSSANKLAEFQKPKPSLDLPRCTNPVHGEISAGCLQQAKKKAGKPIRSSFLAG